VAHSKQPCAMIRSAVFMRPAAAARGSRGSSTMETNSSASIILQARRCDVMHTERVPTILSPGMANIGGGDAALIDRALRSASSGAIALARSADGGTVSGPGRGMDALGAIGSGKQFKGRPNSNMAQNKQVNDAAREVGLSGRERQQLGRAVEAESRHGGANLGYHDIVQIAREIKSGRY
jgi:hypothetical protein